MDKTIGRAPQGARGLKYQRHGQQNYNYSRAPQGARGLKRSRILIAVSLHKKEVSANRQRLPFSILLIKTWVYVVDVFLVQAVLGEAQAFTEAYKMEITSL